MPSRSRGPLVVALAAACHALAPPKVPRAASATRAEPLASRFAADSWSWTQNWFPMAFAKVTDRTSPQRLELLGTALALWWDPVGERWSAMADLCPHRAAPLSEGRVDPEGQLECPYHGWTFESKTGACTKVPQAADPCDATMLRRCGGVSYAVAEKQGLIWVWGEPLSSGASAPDENLIPTCEALDDERFVWIDVSRDMPYSADMLLENVLDSSHVPFTHHQTISKRANAKPLELRLDAPVDASGFSGQQLVDVPIGRAGEANAKAGRRTERTTVYRAPCYMHHKIRSAGEAGTAEADDFDAGFETWTVAYATPTGPGRSKLLARFPFRFPLPKQRRGPLTLLPNPNVPALVFKYLPDWVNHLGQLKVLDDDNIFLPLQERAVADAGGWRGRYVMPTAADTFVGAYRRWFDAAGPVPHHPAAVDFQRLAPLSKEALLDRHAQHTAHCTSCSGALANARKAAKAANGLLFVAAAYVPWLVAQMASRWPAAASTTALAHARAVATALRPLAGLAAAAAAVGAARSFARSVERRLTSGLGEYPPPRNRAEGKGAARELRTVEEGRRA